MTPSVPAAPTAMPSTTPAGAPVATRCSVVINNQIHIPAWVTDLATFRQWLRSDDFPERTRICFINGVIWIDLTMEQLYTHNQIKGEVGFVLQGLLRANDVGLYMPDGMHFSNPKAGISTAPDGIYASYAAFQSGNLRSIPNARNVGVVDLEGTPDMVLEVLSDSSVDKDMVDLPANYQTAGIPEFWRIDARGGLSFEILRLTPTGYVPTQLPDGWWHSDVFGRDFRMTQSTNPLGQPRFTLEVR